MSTKNMTDISKKVYVSFPPNAADSLKTVAMGEKSLRKLLNRVIIDSTRKSETKLGNYYFDELHLLIDKEPAKYNHLLECAQWLQNTKFDNFEVLKIFLRYEANEIITVSDKMNLDVLNEYYDKFFDFVHKINIGVVYMIAKEGDIDYSSMPTYDKVIEVSQL